MILPALFFLAANTVTFSHDVAPIFFEHCVRCHRPGEVAPMSLLDYKSARPWAQSNSFGPASMIRGTTLKTSVGPRALREVFDSPVCSALRRCGRDVADHHVEVVFSLMVFRETRLQVNA